jgi:hypothetical protein
MGFSVPKPGEVLSETEMTEFFAWIDHCARAGNQLAPDIACLIPRIGDRTNDGTLYAGLSPKTGRAMFTTPDDAPSLSTLQQAERYAAELSDAKGRKGFQLPERGELSVLWNNGFTKTEGPAEHWSRTEDRNDPGNSVIARRDRDGKDARLKVRLVRYGETESR